VFHVKQATIFALASANGRAGVSVVRISGPLASLVLRELSGNLPEPRHASLKRLSVNGEVIDQALVLWFPSPKSFTGEDCAELHIHGSKAVSDKLFEVLQGLGLRHAEAGEFSRRAFQYGKLDLTQAEAIADLIDAETEAQRKQALRQLEGSLRADYEAWRQVLIKCLAQIEVYIDFPEEDLPYTLIDQVLQHIGGLCDELSHALDTAKRGLQIREGYKIAIMGEPNTGKSSLFNALLEREAAIVTPVAGTTRDIIEAPMILGSYKVRLYDTAGLRETDDLIEAEGIRRAKAISVDSDLRLWVIDPELTGFDPSSVTNKCDFIIFNKAESSAQRLPEHIDQLPCFITDTKSGMGIEDLRHALTHHVELALSYSGFPAATRERHNERLRAMLSILTSLYGRQTFVPELASEDIRLALGQFDALFGRHDIDDVLDIIFSSFCIGK
jgi:tRNA modification GTPase